MDDADVQPESLRRLADWLNQAADELDSEPATAGRRPASAGTTAANDAPLDPAVEERVIGRGIAYLLANRSWVHRRTEYVRFVDADTVSRQMGVDYTLPVNRRTARLYELRPGLVPLSTLKKRALADFSLWEEDNRRVPMLNTEQNAFYAAAALVATAHGIAREYGESTVPEPVNAMLRLVAARPTNEARAALRALRDGLAAVPQEQVNAWRGEKELSEHVDVFSTHESLAALLMNGPGDPEPADPDAAATWRAQRRASAALDSLAEQLSTQFIVIAQLRGERADFIARRLLKFSYEQPPHAYRPALTRVEQFRRGVREAAEVLSWWPRNITLDALAVGSAASFHVEVVAPDDIELLAALLTAQDPKRPQDEPLRRESTSTERQRIHLQMSGAPRAAIGPLWVQMRASRRGFLNAAVLTSGLIAFLLTVGRHRLDDITAAQGGSSLEAAATLLIAIPGLVSAYLLRPGEHQMASRLLVGTRLLLLVSAACAFAAAGALAGAFPAAERDDIWGTAAAVSLVVVGCLLLSYVMPIVVPALRRAWRVVTPAIRRAWNACSGAGRRTWRWFAGKLKKNR